MFRLYRLVITAFLVVLLFTYWQARGPGNFLWFSDIGMILVVIAAWSRQAILNSMSAVGLLFFEMVWNLDFFVRFLSGFHILGMGATAYMFSESIPLYIRGLSLALHILLPVSILYLLSMLGYDRRAILYQSILVWLVLIYCYFFSDPERNINWVFGIGKQQELVHPLLYLAIEMAAIPLFFIWPTHWLLQKYVRLANGKSHRK